MSEETFDIVDESDTVIGSAWRSEVHGNPALIHRVAHVLVTSDSGSIFLQKRAENKDVQPGKWDTSVGGHVDSGESYEAAATREMREELGITGPKLLPLYGYLHRNSYESEMVRTFLVTWNGQFDIDRSEISAGRFWTIGEIERADPGVFTPNFLDELNRFQRWRDSQPPGRLEP